MLTFGKKREHDVCQFKLFLSGKPSVLQVFAQPPSLESGGAQGKDLSPCGDGERASCTHPWPLVWLGHGSCSTCCWALAFTQSPVIWQTPWNLRAFAAMGCGSWSLCVKGHHIQAMGSHLCSPGQVWGLVSLHLCASSEEVTISGDFILLCPRRDVSLGWGRWR